MTGGTGVLTAGLTSRRLTSVSVVVLAVLGAAYGLGQGAGDRQPRPHPAALASPSPSPTTAPGPPTGAPPRPVVTQDDTGTEQAVPLRPPLPPEKGGGPYGSRRTTGDHSVALTFDDGPDPSYTTQVLAALRKHRVKATFCLVGVKARAYPQLVRAIAADGHTLCNHSWSHDFALGSRSRAAIRADLTRTNDAIREAVPDAAVSYYRQPGGHWTAAVVAVARELGMTSLHWAVDPQDWRRPGAKTLAASVTSGTTAGAIVLLHDGGGDRRNTVAALDTILPNLSRRFRLAALPLIT